MGKKHSRNAEKMEWANDFSTVFRIQRVIPPSAFFLALRHSAGPQPPLPIGGGGGAPGPRRARGGHLLRPGHSLTPNLPLWPVGVHYYLEPRSVSSFFSRFNIRS